ncbi:hypothetical protein DY000_02028774 [Brassica cretica]|uniref:Uncharacterized protein n=1 Tax=Brassica cretica TaxID=69181 RepID=A0ABQ7DBD5_BRACR|nr:hypothetical protein DY000_02028774 [Brassica cretica]
MSAHSSRSPLAPNPIAWEQRKTLVPTERKTTSENRYLTASQKGVMETYQEKTTQGQGVSAYHPFQERVDRHGNVFGERFSTKQTRNPPPEKDTKAVDNSRLTWRQKAAQEKEVDSALAPAPVEQNREPNVAKNNAQTGTHKDHLTTVEEVMEDLHEVTRQYLSCTDPIEAAARRQCVLYSDANGLIEETAARIVASSSNQHNLPLAEGSLNINPNTPPPIQERPFQEILFPDPSILRSPQGGEDIEEDIGLDPYYSDISPSTEAALLNKRKENAERIRSLIVSASMEPRVSRGLSQKPPVQLQAEEEKEETLQEFQNKEKLEGNHLPGERRKMEKRQ